MLLGQYEGKVGVKNRIAFPKKFREELGNKLILSFGFERSLIVQSRPKWQKLIEPVSALPYTRSEARETLRFLASNAFEVDLDDQGRFVIPKNMIDFALIKNTVIFLGLVDWVEIWDLRFWRKHAKRLTLDSSILAQRLAESK